MNEPDPRRLAHLRAQAELAGSAGPPPPAGDPETELELLANVRAFLRAAEGPDFKIPTRVVDGVLDNWSEQRARENDDEATEPATDN